MAEDITPVITGASLSTMAPGAVRQLWQKGVLVAEQQEDFFQQFEGKSNNSLIMTKTELSKGKGHKITFTNLSGFYAEPHLGETRFDGQDDFEEAMMNSYDLKVDFLRHAYSINQRAEEVMGMRYEIKSGLNVEQGKWLGRQKTEKVLAEIHLNLNTSNRLFANGKTRDTLSSSDTLDWDSVVTTAAAMKPMGGRPANVGRGTGGPIWSQTVVATTIALTDLKKDTDYKSMLQEAGERGKLNTVFRGGFPTIDGHTISEYNPIDHDGVGAVGSFMNPKAYLGEAITAGTTAIQVKGGGNAVNAAKTGVLYFKFFPGFAYKFINLDVFAPAAGTNYFLIYNQTGADAGKVGMYSYANNGGANNGNLITINGRLGSADGGVRNDQIGDVTWNTGVWSGKHTDAHPEGSLIIPCNSKGVPIGTTLVFGAMAMFRGYGMFRGKRSTQTLEGGFVEQKFITSVFGQKIREDRIGRQPGIMLLTHAISYPGINLPAVA